MSAHTCKTLTPGCYRCELNKDEIRDHLYSLKVSVGSGIVHEGWCPSVRNRVTLVIDWLASGARDGDRACKRCMPDGLPDLSILT